MSDSLQATLQTRIDILQSQIDRAKESGEKYNAVGLPMKEQIELWETLIASERRKMRSC